MIVEPFRVQKRETTRFFGCTSFKVVTYHLVGMTEEAGPYYYTASASVEAMRGTKCPERIYEIKSGAVYREELGSSGLVIPDIATPDSGLGISLSGSAEGTMVIGNPFTPSECSKIVSLNGSVYLCRFIIVVESSEEPVGSLISQVSATIAPNGTISITYSEVI